MSGVNVVAFLLRAYAPITATVPAARIFGGPIPKGTPIPAIGVEQISGTERSTVSMGEPQRMRQERVQVTVHAADYPTQKQLMERARLACSNRHTPVNGIDVLSILPAGEGPDGYEPALLRFEQTRDFFVAWRSTDLSGA